MGVNFPRYMFSQQQKDILERLDELEELLPTEHMALFTPGYAAGGLVKRKICYWHRNEHKANTLRLTERGKGLMTSWGKV